MKKIITPLVLFMLGFSASAQVNITEAPDFELTDIHDETHHLYEILDAGKYVMVDLYAYWCGPCCSTAPAIKQVFEEYGCNTGDLYVIGLEADGTTAQTAEFETNCGSEGGHPVVSGLDGGASDVVDQFGPVAFPTIILIAPDRTIIEQDIWPFSAGIADGILSGLGIEKQECLTTNTDELEGVIEAVQVIPSPFQDELQVQFQLQQSAQVQVDVLNSLGQVLRTQSLNQLATGAQQTQFATSNLSDGVYFVRITIDGQSSISQKVVKANR